MIARFNLPSVRTNNQAPASQSNSTANDFYSLLASAVTAATTSSGFGKQSRDLSNSGILIPPSVDGEERLSFIAAQRERLSILMSALDKEASNLQGRKVSGSSSPKTKSFRFFDGAGNSTEEESSERPQSSGSALSTRKSEPDFEKIEAESGTEEAETPTRAQAKRAQSSSWMSWSWGAKEATEVRKITI